MTSFPTGAPPSIINAATTALNAASHDHDQHHLDIDERLGELQSALGLVAASGFNGKPTLFDPNAADWADVVANGRGWIQIDFTQAAEHEVDFYIGTADGTAFMDFYANVPDGVNAVWTDGNGVMVFGSNAGSPGATTFLIQPDSGQTAEMVTFGSVFGIAPDGSVGGVAPSVGDSIKWDGTKWVAQA